MNLLTFTSFSCIISKIYLKGDANMKFVWVLGAVAAIYGAIAGAFFDGTPLTAVAFGLLAVVFALAAWRDVPKKS
jgi:membrane protein implicated in regulation of membrane protease activity